MIHAHCLYIANIINRWALHTANQRARVCVVAGCACVHDLRTHVYYASYVRSCTNTHMRASRARGNTIPSSTGANRDRDLGNSRVLWPVSRFVCSLDFIHTFCYTPGANARNFVDVSSAIKRYANKCVTKHVGIVENMWWENSRWFNLWGTIFILECGTHTLTENRKFYTMVTEEWFIGLLLHCSLWHFECCFIAYCTYVSTKVTLFFLSSFPFFFVQKHKNNVKASN